MHYVYAYILNWQNFMAVLGLQNQSLVFVRSRELFWFLCRIFWALFTFYSC
jgi:hypothetical protein